MEPMPAYQRVPSLPRSENFKVPPFVQLTRGMGTSTLDFVKFCDTIISAKILGKNS